MSVPSHADVIVLNRRPGPQRLYPIRAELAALLRAKQMRVVVSEFEGLERAPQALATVVGRGSPISAGWSSGSRRVGRGATPARATPVRTSPRP